MNLFQFIVFLFVGICALYSISLNDLKPMQKVFNGLFFITVMIAIMM